MQNKVLLITFIVSLGLIAFLITKLNSSQILSTQNPCTPTFVDGGGPNYKNDSPERKNISPENSNGTPLAIEGKIYHSDCKTPVKNAILDIWQANETGNYEDEWYRGKVITKYGLMVKK
jgi:protocatechuate 3,4-dioxygenase beta subunit